MKAQGILRHGFFGDYHAAIGLEFADEASARDALCVLGDKWKLREGKPVLTWGGNRDELEVLKEQFKRFGLRILPCSWKHCRDKCASAEIDGLPHSIDFGPSFELTIDVVPSEQRSLFT